MRFMRFVKREINYSKINNSETKLNLEIKFFYNYFVILRLYNMFDKFEFI